MPVDFVAYPSIRRGGQVDGSDEMNAAMQAFKSSMDWAASSELRLLTMAHDKLVAAFVSVAWTREINSKTMEMYVCVDVCALEYCFRSSFLPACRALCG